MSVISSQFPWISALTCVLCEVLNLCVYHSDKLCDLIADGFLIYVCVSRQPADVSEGLAPVSRYVQVMNQPMRARGAGIDLASGCDGKTVVLDLLSVIIKTRPAGLRIIS